MLYLKFHRAIRETTVLTVIMHPIEIKCHSSILQPVALIKFLIASRQVTFFRRQIYKEAEILRPLTLINSV